MVDWLHGLPPRGDGNEGELAEDLNELPPPKVGLEAVVEEAEAIEHLLWWCGGRAVFAVSVCSAMCMRVVVAPCSAGRAWERSPEARRQRRTAAAPEERCGGT